MKLREIMNDVQLRYACKEFAEFGGTWGHSDNAWKDVRITFIISIIHLRQQCVRNTADYTAF